MKCKERLTMHTPEGACLTINANNEIDARQELHDKFKLACNKLAELEDKLENGTLIELPCKVGDNVYIQCDTVNQNIPYKIEDIHIDDENISFFATAYDIYYGEFLDEKMFTIDEFEKTVFLTKEEAEARRKELQND